MGMIVEPAGKEIVVSEDELAREAHAVRKFLQRTFREARELCDGIGAESAFRFGRDSVRMTEIDVIA